MSVGRVGYLNGTPSSVAEKGFTSKPLTETVRSSAGSMDGLDDVALEGHFRLVLGAIASCYLTFCEKCPWKNLKK